MTISGENGKLSVTDFAKLIGVTGPAVSLAIKRGRLVKSVEVLPNGRFLIDAAVGRIEFEDNKRRGARNSREFKERKAAAESAEGADLMESERRLKHYQAELARVKLEEQEGKLVNAEDVKNQAFKVARAVRDAMMNIPGKVSAEIAGETDQFTIHARLEDEIRQALENLNAEIVDEADMELDGAGE